MEKGYLSSRPESYVGGRKFCSPKFVPYSTWGGEKKLSLFIIEHVRFHPFVRSRILISRASPNFPSEQRTTNIISTRSSTTDLLETTFCMFVTFVSLESCARSRNRILLFRENSRNGETNCEIAE